MRCPLHLLLGATLSLVQPLLPRTALAEEASAQLALAVVDPRGPGSEAGAKLPAIEAAAPDEEAIDPRVADARRVAEELSQRMGALRACYEHELRHQPTLAGTVELRFSIAKDGTVRRTRVAGSQLGSKPLARCLVSRLDGAHFAPPTRGALEFAYPLRFRPRM